MGIKEFIWSFSHPFSTICNIISAENTLLLGRFQDICTQRIYTQSRIDYYNELALKCSDKGTREQLYGEEEVVVSLTTYGKRIHDVHLPIETIMQGSLKPNRIVLWLSTEMKYETLPIAIQRQQQRGLEVRYCEDIRSYKKIIPSLEAFPDSCIITIDDDVLYRYDLVENLYASYKRHPNAISASRIHKIVLGEDCRPISYNNWEWRHPNTELTSKLFFFTGVGGVLYPPHIFSEEVLNKTVFLDICKTADDVWLNAMALLNDVPVYKAFTHSNEGVDYLDMGANLEPGLCQINTNKVICRNDIQIKAVFEKYNLYEKLKDAK